MLQRGVYKAFEYEIWCRQPVTIAFQPHFRHNANTLTNMRIHQLHLESDLFSPAVL